MRKSRLPVPTKRIPRDPTPLIEAFKEVVKEYQRLKQIREIEQTKRKAIDAQIETIRTCVVAFLEEFRKLRDEKLREREDFLSILREAYLCAVANNDHEMVKIVGEQIVQILNSPVVRYEEVEGLMGLLEPLKGGRGEEVLALPSEEEDAIPAEIVL